MKKIVLLITSLFMLVSAIYATNYQVVEAKEVGAGIQPILVHYPRPEVIEEKIVEEVKTELKQYVSKQTFTVEMNDVEEDKQEPIVEETVQEETIIEEVETEEIIEDLPEQTLEDVVEENTMIEETSEDASNIEDVVDRVIEVVDKVQSIDFEAKINNLIDKIYNKVEAPLSTLYLYQHAVLGGGRTLNFGQDHVVTATILKSNAMQGFINYLLVLFIETGLDEVSFKSQMKYYPEQKISNHFDKDSPYFYGKRYSCEAELNDYDQNLIMSTGNLLLNGSVKKIVENGKTYCQFDLHFCDVFNAMPKEYNRPGNESLALFNKIATIINKTNIIKDYEWNAYATLKIEV